MTRFEFLGSFIERALRWISTGAAIGAYCGIVVGAIHGFFLICLAYVLRLILTLFRRASVFSVAPLTDFSHWLLIIVYGVFVGAFFGAIAGVIIGSLNFFVLSCSPHRFKWPQIVNAPAKSILVVALRSSLIGAFCVATSTLLILVGLRKGVDESIGVATYIVGAIGGFAVGVFLGARNIIRENAARESSTR